MYALQPLPASLAIMPPVSATTQRKSARPPVLAISLALAAALAAVALLLAFAGLRWRRRRRQRRLSERRPSFHDERKAGSSQVRTPAATRLTSDWLPTPLAIAVQPHAWFAAHVPVCSHAVNQACAQR